MRCVFSGFSKYQQFCERAPFVEARDRLRKKRRRRENIELIARRAGRKPKGGNRIGYDDPVEHGVGERLSGAFHEETVSCQSNYSACPGGSSRPGRTDERAPGADQIVNDERGCSGHVADEEISGYDASAAMFVGEGLADGLATDRL